MPLILTSSRIPISWHGNYYCLMKGKYVSGNTALFVWDEDGLPVAELSYDLSLITLPPDYLILKDYSENGILVTHLSNLGLIHPVQLKDGYNLPSSLYQMCF